MWQFRRALIPQDGAQQYPLSPQRRKKKKEGGRRKKKDELGRYAFIPSPGCETRGSGARNGMAFENAEWHAEHPPSASHLRKTSDRLLSSLLNSMGYVDERPVHMRKSKSQLARL